MAVEAFLKGKRILYGAPTTEQVDRFWVTVTAALYEPIKAKVFRKNETEHTIELIGTEQRIRAKTCWSADTLRGDYADLLILDEWQMMNEDAWGVVGAPMLADNNGNAAFIYTPPSLRSAGQGKADDPRHAAKLFKRACEDTTGRWKAFHFTSFDNPYISKDALTDLSSDMTSVAYRQEIMAEDLDEAPGALWQRKNIDKTRVTEIPNMNRIVVAVDPSATSTGDEAGIITAGRHDDDYYALSDDSIQASPEQWARMAVTAYHKYKANVIVAESNNGGEMVSQVIKQIDPNVPVRLVHASRGKATRAEPIAAIYEQGRGHHFGNFALLEDEMCMWTPGDESPNRMDALVWAMTDLSMIGQAKIIQNPFGY
jgi:phage terminase large subunit-like protein